MKLKGKNPKEVCLSLLKRSDCHVQMAAVLSDKNGIFAWGWNSAGPSGLGEHAEENCLKRASHKRASGAVMWVAGRYKKSKNNVNANPCAFCWPLLKLLKYVAYRAKNGEWKIRETGLS